ncbi:MAG: UvrD-helicase domain-containing protein [Candidatus Omnitrophota bacterium]
MKAKKLPTHPRFNKHNANLKLSFPHIFVYEASAGSGKTRKLAERYVDFLLYYSHKIPLPFNFRNILAVTFTNEAADQMRQETMKMLKAKALGKNRDSRAAIRIVDEIIENFSDFAVRTIDSFVHSLLVASSLELKLPPDYEIVSQPRPYLEYVLDTFLEEILRDQGVRRLFLKFLEHFLVVEGQKHWNPKKTLLELLIKFYREENGRAKLFKEISGDLDLGRIENEFKQRIQEFLSAFIPSDDSAAPGDLDFNRRFTKGMYSALGNSGMQLLKGLSLHINKPLIPGEGILNKDSREAALGLVRQWKELTAQYNDYTRAFVWLRYSLYLKIFSRFRECLDGFKEEKRIVFLDELNRKARKFLTSEGLLPAEIYYKLSSVLYHYMIDEFQDTSILQWENIQALVEDALAKGGSLFYVGDKKQAIYRFRGGEVELFDSIKAKFRNQVAGIYDQVLPCNYRSRETIVEFNNSVFSRSNLINFLSSFSQLGQGGRERVLDIFKDSHQEPAGKDCCGGYVRLEILEGDNKQQLEDCLNIKLKETIFQLKKRFNYKDILILVRDNHEAEAIAGFLLQEGITVCASRTVSIRNNYIIRQIIALLKFLNSPIDNLSFANFILGGINTRAVKIDPAKLQAWMEGLRVDNNKGVIYTLFRSEYPKAWEEFFQYLFNAVGFLPVYDLVKTILIKFNIEENFPDFCGFTQRLLEIINDLKEQGRNSLCDFLEWFEEAPEEELFVRLPSGLDAIKILTIHKAKGLSSPVVILPYAALEVKVGDSARVVHETPEGLYLLYLQKEICQSHPGLSLIYQEQYFQSLLDELNCLYVGFTRAGSELYIYLPQKINRSDNPLVSLLFDQQGNFIAGEKPQSSSSADKTKMIREFGRKIVSSGQTKPKQLSGGQKAKAPLRRVLPQEVFQEALKRQFIPIEEITSFKTRSLAKRGELLHYLLAEINPLDFINQPSVYDFKIQDACRLFNYSDPGGITRSLREFLNDSDIKRLFSLNLEAFNEKEIVDCHGNLNRIDRLVFDQKKILIIDYKTGQAYQEKHREQIKEYARLIKEIYPGKLVEAKLIYIDTKEICPVKL